MHREFLRKTKRFARGAPIVRSLVKMTPLDKTDVDVSAARGVVKHLPGVLLQTHHDLGLYSVNPAVFTVLFDHGELQF